ncbi:uncharacterized protein LOC116145737 isoform X2 [Pistacia vera]|uniref:uncharacterized protein LOC116145737 isoform X2 n=1 Tax=Pistacia vera TaxID=55513 RepID=UPI0012636FB3|nr:uncharacterized protein LOC116145737 isoform X2 [Pistacia vera]
MELATSSTNCRTIFSPTTTLACKHPSQVTHSLLSQPVFSPITNRRPISLSFSNMVSNNGYAGQPNRRFSFDTNNSKFYKRLDSCLVIPPLNGKKPRAIIKFLGGAFIGAVPEVTYSNGALIQVLIGSYFSEKIPKANAIISFNNRPATEAVPYFEQLGPIVSQMMPIVEASPVYSMARSASGDAWKVLLDTAGAIIPGNDQESLVSLNNFVNQLPSVFSQVTEGMSEFKPTPSENRDCFKKSYNVPHTLLVKFSFDTIDDTDLLEETLRPRVESIGGTVEKIQLNGNHITPCVQEPKWQAGSVYTPADAIAQGLKTLSINEIRILSKTISDWFRRFEG